MQYNLIEQKLAIVSIHDSRLIEYAIKLWKKSNQIDIANFEFQFLRVIRDELKKDLVEKGFGVAEYLHYAIRRLKEKKRNILLVDSLLYVSNLSL